MPLEHLRQKQLKYDKEKYREMILEAPETALAYFGFDRSVYGDTARNNRKWWHDVRQQRTREIVRQTM
jgi:hypothetical protein